MYTTVAASALILGRDCKSVETFLNSIWLLVAIFAVGIWRYRWLPSRGAARYRALPEFVALVCALALLFPSVSLTDDLHPDIVAVDAASGKRNSSLLLARAPHANHAAPKIAVHAVAVLPHNAPLTAIGATKLVISTKNIGLAIPRSGHRGRSPPSSFL
jgi:hypothetical protein